MIFPVNRKIKICHVVSRMNIGGMENGIVNLCNRLNRNLFIPMICCVKGQGPMINRLRPDVTVFDLGFQEGKNPLRFVKLATFFVQQKPDIVHTHGWGACSVDGILGAYLSSVKSIINCEHGYLFLRKYQLFIQILLTMLCEYHIAVSRSLKTRILKEFKFFPGEIIVISNGVDTTKFNISNTRDADRTTLLRTLNIKASADKIVIANVGSFKPEKNQIMLLKAIKMIKQEYPDFGLLTILVGDGINRPCLEQFVYQEKLSEDVHFVGEQNNIHEILSMVDILVSTSIPDHEGMSNVILEAMASGIPVISTTSVGSSELIIDGVNGFLIEPDDVAQLKTTIVFLIEKKSLSRQIGQNGRQMICEKYSIEKMVSDYEELYLNCINRRKS